MREALKELPRGAEVLVPRIPGPLLAMLAQHGVRLIPAEECTKQQLFMLRQLHRAREHVKDAA